MIEVVDHRDDVEPTIAVFFGGEIFVRYIWDEDASLAHAEAIVEERLRAMQILDEDVSSAVAAIRALPAEGSSRFVREPPPGDLLEPDPSRYT